MPRAARSENRTAIRPGCEPLPVSRGLAGHARERVFVKLEDARIVVLRPERGIEFARLPVGAAHAPPERDAAAIDRFARDSRHQPLADTLAAQIGTDEQVGEPDPASRN